MTVKKTLIVLMIAATLLTSLTGSAFAAFGGPSDSRISVGNNEYDQDQRKFVYRVNTQEVLTNLPDGIATTGSFSATVPDGVAARLFRDGLEVPGADLTAVTEPGRYILMFGDNNSNSLKFTILPEVTGMLREFTLPSGFTLTSVTRDGEAVELGSSYIADLTQEGRYVIQYGSEKADLKYTLGITVDHTAPTLKLEAVQDGYAAGPVDISDLEQNTQISILLNDAPLTYSKELTKSGTYQITLKDEAGNTTTYHFVIRVYFNFNTFAFLFILVGVLVALTVYLVLSRKKLRIR